MLDFVNNYSEYIKMIISIIAIVDPIGAVPVFLTLTADKSADDLYRIPRITAITVFVILSVVIWTGDSILRVFGIGVSAFQAGGGLLILIMSISMMHARPTRVKRTQEETEEAQDKEAIAVVPLATPLLAGPGAISMVMIHTNHISSVKGKLFLTVSVLVVAIIVWLTLRLAEPIGKKLGVTGLNITTRLMGLILAGIAVQMITTGLKALLPGLAG